MGFDRSQLSPAADLWDHLVDTKDDWTGVIHSWRLVSIYPLILGNFFKLIAGENGGMSMDSQNMSADVLLRPGVGRVLDALSNRERRHLLIELRAGRIAHEADVVTRGEDRALLQLRHTHLPKLAAMGFVEWNQDTGEIGAGSRFDEIEPLLDLIERHADELPADWP